MDSGIVVEDEYAFTFISNKINMIIINDDAPLTSDEKKIVLRHELSHLKGIDDEEKADRDAMKYLNSKQKKILITNWMDRHGHIYSK